MKHAFTRWLFVLIAAGLTSLAAATHVLAERPTAPHLLPHDTLAMVRIADLPLLVERLQSTAFGQIVQDPRLQPLVAQLVQAARDGYKSIESRVGLPLDQLLKLPQGEVCVALLAPPEFEQEPGLVLLIDTRDQVDQARQLIAAAEQIAQKRGGARGVERFGNEQIVTFTGLGDGRVFMLERDGAFIFATTKNAIEKVAANLSGSGLEKTLAETDNYNTLLSRCSAAGQEPAQVTWYLDPLTFVRRLASDSPVAIGLALLPVLGLDGLQAVGGTLTFATKEYDDIQHLHVLLDNPRVGVIDAVALSSGDITPESWVPGDAVLYSTAHWDLPHTLKVANKLYNSVLGEGEWEQQLRTRVSEPLGLDFERELLPHISGRATFALWVEPPLRENSPVPLIGLQLKDPQAFQPILEKLLKRHAPQAAKQRYGAFDYWLLEGRQPRGRELGPNLRQPSPCAGIIGDTLLVTDSLKAYQEAVTAHTNPETNLASSLDFKLISSKVAQQRGGDAPGAMNFVRNEELFRFAYDLATSEKSLQRLNRRAERRPGLRVLNQALTDHPLPPFSVLAEYLASSGALLTNDETGIHYMTFTLKRK